MRGSGPDQDVREWIKHPAHVRQRRPSSLASLRSRVASALAESSSHLPSNQSNQPRVDGELSGVLAFFVPPSGAPVALRLWPSALASPRGRVASTRGWF